MTQREDLEYAAKAAGMPKGSVVGSGDYLYESGGIVIYWNPLDNNADAFSLMVTLHIDITFDGNLFDGTPVTCSAMWPPFDDECLLSQVDIGNKEAATRLAIFRAAVAIGKEMK